MSNELDIMYARTGATVKAIVSYFSGGTLTQRGATTALTQEGAPFVHRYLGDFAGIQPGDQIDYFDDTDANMIPVGKEINAGGVVLASNGLDYVDNTEITNIPTTFRESFMWLFQRFFNKQIRDATKIQQTKADDTVITEQTFVSAGPNETVNKALGP